MPFLSGYWETVLVITGLNIIAALGLYIVMSTGQMSVGQSAFMAISAYIGGILSIRLGLPLPVAILAGLAAATVVGFLVGYVLLPLDHWFFAVATLALGIAVVATLETIAYVGGPAGFYGFTPITNLGIVSGVVVALVALFVWHTNSPLDLVFRAVRDEPAAAQAIGISVSRARVLAFTLGAFLAGLAGILQAHFLTLVRPHDFSFATSLTLLVFVAVGGTETFLGAVFGALLLTIVPEVLRFSGAARLVLHGAFLVVVILLRPKGLFGRWTTGMSPAQALRAMVGRIPRFHRGG